MYGLRFRIEQRRQRPHCVAVCGIGLGERHADFLHPRLQIPEIVTLALGGTEGFRAELLFDGQQSSTLMLFRKRCQQWRQCRFVER